MVERSVPTKSICPECLRVLPAERRVENGDVYLVRTCPDHGTFKVLVWRDEKLYAEFESLERERVKPKTFVPVEKECPLDCGLCAEHEQQTCVAVIEVTSRCNLRCPYCFAASDSSGAYNPDLDVIKGMFRTLVEKTKRPYVVQISGGEPTVRKDLPEIVALGKGMGIDYIELNTNGIALAKNPTLLEELKDAGLDALFFSFDGVTPDVYEKRCGVDLLRYKLKVLERCAELGIGVILVPVVVRGVNDGQIGEIIKFALKNNPPVIGVHFQPVTFVGRSPNPPSDDERATIPDVIRAIEEQTNGMLREDNFIPTTCTNVHCDATSYSVVFGEDNVLPLTYRSFLKHEETAKVDISEVTRKCICEQWRAPLLHAAGAEAAPGSWEELVEKAKTNYLTVSMMAFMDAWTFDVDRLRKCCVHEVTPDGRLIPFCAFNVLYRSAYYGDDHF